MTAADDLCRFVDASPTPFHAVETAAARLEEAGYTRVEETQAWPEPGGRHLVVRGGSLVAWDDTAGESPTTPFRIIGAHTDSPNLRVKEHHDRALEGTDVVALEPYGAPLLSTWFDRDLAVAGRVALRDGTVRLVHVAEPVLRVPNLAIHLEREGAVPDKQRGLDAVWSQSGTPFLDWLGERSGFDGSDVLGFELMTADAVPSARVGVDGWLVAAPRLDNQATCFAGIEALVAAPSSHRQVLVLFDHEEVGSSSERGAGSDLLLTVVERVVAAAGGTRDDVHRAVAGSIIASGDMAHATHPNRPERHEPLHRIALGGGPVLKVNQNLRYATDAVGAAEFARACEQAGVPLQRYVHRADLPCGSTIGPISAARTGIRTVDFGAPQLAMHSARETMAAADVEHYVAALTAFLAPA